MEPEPERPERPSGQAAKRPMSKRPSGPSKTIGASGPSGLSKTVGASGPSDHIKMEACKDLTDNL